MNSMSKTSSMMIKITGTTNLSDPVAEKHRKDIEGKITERAQAIAYYSLPLETKALPEGQFTVANLKAAVAKSSMETNSLILNWHTGQAKRIGKRCKVYWDGDMTWYYARIINYDSVHDKHFIYYEVDNTVEWINLANETVLVAEDIQLVKYGSQTYPCLTYWLSTKARDVIKTLRGYKKGGDYIEYFNEDGLGEYEFANVKSLSPLNSMGNLQDDGSPTRGKLNKRFRACMESAKAEQVAVNSVVELVVPEVKQLAFLRLQGEKWIGMRVRASTQRLKDTTKVPDAAPVSAKCVGTIVKYCPNTDKHLVIFDQDLLQPLWVQMFTENKGKHEVELLLAPDEVMEDASEAFHRCQGPVSLNDCALCGLGVSDQDRLPEYQLDALHKCQSCNQSYHSYCYPEVDERIPSFWKYWRCWKCIRCDLCKNNLWDMPMMAWNLSHVTTAINRNVQICGSCLDNYTNKNNFCPICGDIYANEFVATTTVNTENQRESTNPIVTEAAVPENVETTILQPPLPKLDDQMMVECNECNRWIHAQCDGIDQEQYDAITVGAHPVWGDEYLCPLCRVSLSAQMVSQLQGLDVTRMFAEPVTEAIAKNYFDIIRHPMDLLTIARKAKLGHYKSLQSLRQDCELMCLNALVFNKVGDEYWTEAYDYYAHVTKSVFDANPRATVISAYGLEILSIVDKSKAELKTIRDAKEKEGKKGKKRRDSSLPGDIYAGLFNYVDWNGKPLTAPSSRRTRQKVEDGEKVLQQNLDDDPIICQPVQATPSTPISKKTTIIGGEAEDDVYDAMSPNTQRDFEGTLTIPTELTPVTTVSYVACAAITLPQDAAYLESFHDACLVCASADASSWFLYCIDCGEAFHSFCVDAPLASMNEFHRLSWRCANCKICETCGDADETGGNNLIYCDACDKTFHMKCLNPIMETSIDGASFYCLSCVQCKGMSNASHSWGFKSDMCFKCQHPIQKSSTAATSNIVIAPIVQSKTMTVTSSQEMLSKPSALITCGVCRQALKAESPTLFCFQCQCQIHLNCVDQEMKAYLFLHKSGIVQDWRCSRCIVQVVNRYQGRPFCHLGEASSQKLKLLNKIGLIQRRRINQSRMIRCSAISAFDKLIQGQWTGTAETLCLQSIIRWAYRRTSVFTASQLNYTAFLNIKSINTLIPPKFPSHGPHAIQGDSPAIWSRCRAHRYVALLRLKAAKVAVRNNAVHSSAKAESASTENPAMTYIQTFIRRPPNMIVAPSMISILWREASLASAFLRYTEPSILDSTVSAVNANVDQELDRELVYLTNILRQRNIPTEPQVLLAKFLAIYRQLLCQPVGLREVLPLPEKYIECNSFGDATSIPHALDADLLVLPHWAPAGKRTMLLNSVKRSVVSSMTSAAQSIEQQKQLLAARLERQTQPDRVPQSIPAISRVISLSLTPIGSADNYFNKKLKQQLDPSSSIYDTYAKAIVPLKPYPAAVETLLMNLSNDRLTFEREERERILNLHRTVNEVVAAPPLLKPEHNLQVEPGSSSDLPSIATPTTIPVTNEISQPTANVSFNNSSKVNSLEVPQITAPSTTVATDNLGSSFDNQLSKKRKVSVILDQSCLTSSDKSTLDFTASTIVPNSGWEQSSNTPMSWFDCRVCCLCKSAADITTGRLLSYSDGLAAHVNCLRYSDGVYEKSNTLHNAFKAREKGARTKCWYCDDRGASIQCQGQSCKRTYHLPCALASNCIFLETKNTEDIPSTSHAIYTYVYCPEHCHALLNLGKTSSTAISHRVGTVLEPLRPLFLDSHYTAESEELAVYMSKCQKKNDPASVRAGAIVVHNIGTVLMDQPSFSSKNVVSPYRYRSCRIFWSMTKAWTRATYVLEVFKSTDMIYTSEQSNKSSQSEDDQSSLRNACELLDESRSIYALSIEQQALLKSIGFILPQANANDDYEIYPVYRIQCFESNDAGSLPTLYTGSLDEALAVIISKVILLQKAKLPSHVTRKNLSSSSCFGLNPATFFGLGLPFVRHAIERVPETLALMLLPLTSPRRYYPAYYLPPAEAATRMTLYLQSLKQYMLGKIRKSINGCYRADPRPRHGGAYRPRRAMNKTLSKAVGSESDAVIPSSTTAEKTVDGVDPAESSLLENQRILSMRYQTLASAYLRDPHASLVVRKSSIHGYGLFARTSFDKDDMLVEYIGQKIRQVIADRREVQYEDEGVGSCYLFRQDRDAIIDATRIGGMARFINHCCEPNAYARIIVTKPLVNNMFDPSNELEEKHIVIMAARDIAPGEEITYDYKFPVEETKLKCYCGAASCSGVMN